MALNITTNITNTLNGYTLDAGQVKGTLVVVANTAERDALPTATKVTGTICYVNQSNKFYKWSGEAWVDSIPTREEITAINSALDGKQATISDLSTIRSNATAGAEAATTIGTYGDIVTHNTSEFATSTQGAKADTALQPAALNDYRTSNAQDIIDATKLTDVTINNTSVKDGSVAKITLQTDLSSDSNNSATTTAIRSFVNSSIASSAANYVTSNSSGDSFATEAALTAGPYFYNGSSYTLKNNDYAMVQDAGASHGNKQARYLYTKTDSTGSWNFQYTVGQAFTSAQEAALNSGVNATKVGNYDTHLANTTNPHGVTKAQVGLGNVDNTSDLNKPISTATQTALDGKQSTLSQAQLNATNSGITSSKVSTYDGYATTIAGKQDTLPTTSTAGKVLTSTSTSGELTWGDLPVTATDLVI